MLEKNRLLLYFLLVFISAILEVGYNVIFLFLADIGLIPGQNIGSGLPFFLLLLVNVSDFDSSKHLCKPLAEVNSRTD